MTVSLPGEPSNSTEDYHIHSEAAPLSPRRNSDTALDRVRPRSHDVTAIIVMIAAELLLAAVNATVKWAGSWPSARIMLVRFSIDLCLSLGLCAYQRCKLPGACEIVILLLRGVCYCSFILFFWAALQSCLPLGDVVVLVIATSPLFLVLSARLFLGETIPPAWPVQMLLLGTGAALVNKPSFLGLAPPSTRCPAWMAALPVGAAICGAFMNLASRRVKHLPPVTLLLANDAVAVVFACVVAFAQEGSGAPALLRPPLDGSTLLIALSAVLGFAGLMGNVYAYQTVSVTAIASVAGSISVPFNYAFQVLFFAEAADGLACAGAALIMATTIGAAIARYVASKQEQPDKSVGLL